MCHVFFFCCFVCFSRQRRSAGVLVVPGFDGRVGAGAEGGAPVGLRVHPRGGAAAAVQRRATALLRPPGPLHVLLRLARARGMMRHTTHVKHGFYQT